MKSKAFSLLVVTLMLSSAIISLLPLASAQEADTIYIDEGSYYIAGPYDSWSYSEIWINVTVEDGGNVDIYVMSYTQIENAYDYNFYYDGQSTGANDSDPRAVSYKPASEENTSSARIHYVFDISDEDYYMGPDDGVFIIIDNRECDITPDDADPSGVVTVKMTTEYTEGAPFDDFDDFLWPIIGVVIIEGLVFVGAIVFIVMLVMHFDKKKKEKQALQPPPAYPYYPGQPFQYQQPMYPPQQAQPPQPQPVQQVEPIVHPPSEAPAQPPEEASAQPPIEGPPKRPKD